jgi:hypothetical protein
MLLIIAACWEYKFFPDYAYMDKAVERIKREETKVFIFGDSHPDVFKYIEMPSNWVLLTQPSDNIQDIGRKIDLVIELSPEVEQVIIQSAAYHITDYRKNKNNNTFSSSISAYYDKRILNLINWLRLQFPILNPKQHFILKSYFLKWLRGGKIDPYAEEVTQSVSGNVPDTRVMEQYGGDFNADLYQFMTTTIQKLKRHNIQVITVEYPVTREYRNELQKYDTGNLDEKMNELDIDVKFDYRSLIDDKKLFKDSDHLNSAGARKLRERLISDLEEI